MLGNTDGQVQAFLEDQARYHGEQRARGRFKLEQLAHMVGIDFLALPFVRGKPANQVFIGFRIPAGVDAIGNPAEQPLAGLALQKAFQATAKGRRGDFLGVSRTHGGDVAGIRHACLDE